METETSGWGDLSHTAPILGGKNLSEIEMECVFRNANQDHLVTPLRQALEATTRVAHSTEQAEQQRRSALALQEQWDTLFAQREQLRIELRRGGELLEQVQEELATQRACLEDWPLYERVCGHNPLPDYMQSLLVKERMEQFLPGWLSRREESLKALQRKMEHCAKENGLEHLL